MKQISLQKTIAVQLARFPVFSSVYDQVVTFLEKNERIYGIGLKGSLIKGSFDRFSDIDLVVFVKNKPQVEIIKKKINTYFIKYFNVVSSFPATHIGFNDLLIFFLESDKNIIKVDIEVAIVSEAPRKMNFISIYDKKGQIGKILSQKKNKPYTPDFADLYSKFTGWIWYTYTKIMRGELLEAADSINVMRNYALIPIIQKNNKLPFEGLRFIEKRVSNELLEKLLTTYPKNISKTQLIVSLKNLVNLFNSQQASLLSDKSIAGKKKGFDFIKEFDKIVLPQKK